MVAIPELESRAWWESRQETGFDDFLKCAPGPFGRTIPLGPPIDWINIGCRRPFLSSQIRKGIGEDQCQERGEGAHG